MACAGTTVSFLLVLENLALMEKPLQCGLLLAFLRRRASFFPSQSCCNAKVIGASIAAASKPTLIAGKASGLLRSFVAILSCSSTLNASPP